MESNEKKPLPLLHLDVEITKHDMDRKKKIDDERKEAENISKMPGVPRLRLTRGEKDIVEKMTTPLFKLEDLFISYQLGKQNSKETIQFYKDCFTRIYRFICFNYTQEVKDYSALLKTYNNDETQLARQLPIAYLESDDFEQDYYDYLMNYASMKRQGGVKEQTMLKEFRGLRAICYYAMEHGWLERRTISVKNIEPDIKQVYTKEEINMLLVEPDRDNYKEYRNWVMINYLLATGNRLGSVLGLRVRDIDFDDRMVNVNEQKNRKPTRIPFVESIVPILKQWISDYCTNEDGSLMLDVYLFGDSSGEPIAVNTASHSIAEYNKQHGVTKTSVHLFRHTFAKNWIVSGGDILGLQRMLNHKSLDMVKRYANLYNTDIQGMAETHVLLNKIVAERPKKARRRRV